MMHIRRANDSGEEQFVPRDGGWDAMGVYGDQSPHLQHLAKPGTTKPQAMAWYGSRELTTVFFLEAILAVIR